MRRGPLWLCRILGSREGKSRNKVAVGEPAAGSPPKKAARLFGDRAVKPYHYHYCFEGLKEG